MSPVGEVTSPVGMNPGGGRTESPREGASSGRSPANPDYTRYHPSWHRERIPIFWWLRRLAYTKFIVRELTAVAVAYAALLLLFQVWAVGQGPAAYERLTAWMGHPLAVAFHVFVVLGLLFHTVTWLNLAPKALVVKMGKIRVAPSAVLVGHYVAWAVISAVVAWLLLGGA